MITSLHILLIFLTVNTSFCTDYDQYDYDWLTVKPETEAEIAASTRSPDDDDVIIDQLDNRKAVNNEILGGFSNEKSFSCPHAKPILHTGESVAQISPEDIQIVGAMGDSLASGRGLWPFTDVEFRGAAFPIGGDANMDGLVTIPNILSQFVKKLEGISHGMGSKHALPDYQFNVAEIGGETEDLPAQAFELVHRMQHYVGKSLKKKWALITIVTGSEEFCEKCEPPSRTSIRRALGVLRRGVPRALVVLLGPVHVASTYRQNINLMRPRCKCLEKMTGKDYRQLFDVWKTYFIEVEEEFNFDNTTFGNFKTCTTITEDEWQKQHALVHEHKTGKEARQEAIRTNLLGVILAILGLSILSVLGFGTYFYCHGMKATKGRFDYGKTIVEPEETEEK
ncbi:unnamed protein product [Caenorhabditis sp. 36 PRJEB53466]|nr:unnamed protein product [Caenorhabditis sp. 36 PRJEB53466]